jgi:phage shock protein A
MEAQADLVNYGKGKSLEKQFQDLECSEQIEAELTDLKKSLQRVSMPTDQA